MPSVTRAASQTRASKQNENDQVYANELKSIKEMLSSLINATNTNTAEIAEIKSLSTQTDANVKKVSEQNIAMNLSVPQSPAMKYVNDFRARSYAAATASVGTPGIKRKRVDTIERPKPKFPEPKVGTNSNANGLTIVPRVNRVRDDKPVFAKALYVSGLGPATSSEEIADYIVSNTTVNDLTKFKVHKMVKKDADITKLKYVSFKVELNVDELEILDNKELWPQGVRVREFEQKPKTVLGDFFPSLQAKQATVSAPPTNTIDLNNEPMETVA